MQNVAANCGKCGTPYEAAVEGSYAGRECPSCGRANMLYVFPALFRTSATGDAGQRIVVDDESTCFYHGDKRATIVCEGCGRFLCALCDIEIHGKHLCTACIERSAADDQDNFKREHTQYDKIAVSLAVVPMLIVPFIYFTIFTAPVALYIAIRHWNTPVSAVPRRRWRFVVAMIFASLQLLLWVGGVLALVGAFAFNE